MSNEKDGNTRMQVNGAIASANGGRRKVYGISPGQELLSFRNFVDGYKDDSYELSPLIKIIDGEHKSSNECSVKRTFWAR